MPPKPKPSPVSPASGPDDPRIHNAAPLWAARLHMIQAGFGDNLILEFPEKSSSQKSDMPTPDDHKYWLIDGGPGTSGLSGAWELISFLMFAALNRMGIQRLERVIVTHNDSDHVNGIMCLLQSLGDKSLSAKAAAIRKSPAFSGAYNATESAAFLGWIAGYQALNSNAKFPIDNIWFNDYRAVKKSISGFTSAPDDLGWMEEILNRFKAVYPKPAHPPGLNQEWTSKGSKGIGDDIGIVSMQNSAGRSIPHVRLLGPTNDELRRLGVVRKDNWVVWKIDENAYNKHAAKKKIVYHGSLGSWSRANDGKRSPDESDTNLSSIMFEFTDNNGGTILLTGDSTGTVLENSIGKGTPRFWTTMKIMHHGSSRNSLLVPETTGSSTDRPTMKDCCETFFHTFKAKKYCISASTFSRCPNPDITTCVAIVRQNQPPSGSGEFLIYATNGVTSETFYQMKTIVTPGSATPFSLYFLRRNGSSTVNWGTVTNCDIATSEEIDGWIKIDTETTHHDYFVDAMPIYFLMFWDEETSRDKQLRIKKIRDLTTGRRRNDRIGLRPRRSYVRVPATRVSRRLMALVKQRAKRKKAVFTRSLFTTAAPPLPQAAVTSSNSVATWHNLMTSGLLSSDLEDSTDFDSTSVPSLVSGAVVEDGATWQWVDLATFISYVEKDYNASHPKPIRPPPITSLLTPLKAWYGDQPSSSDAASPVLASMLLQALIGTDDTVEFFNSLPLNANGSQSLSSQLWATNKPAAVMSMVVQNFRACIVVPTQAQYLSGARMDVPAYYFELTNPPSSINNIASSEFLSWTVPFENALWKHGQVSFQHQGPLKVKMVWPQFLNHVTLIHFDSIMNVSRETSVHGLPCRGVMTALAGKPATYDIQLKPDSDGLVDMMTIYKTFAPLEADFFGIFGPILRQFDVPGIDLPSIIAKDLKLQNAGIILSQTKSSFGSVSVEDFYGTIATSQVLQLALDILHLPHCLSIPSNLPSLTVTFNNIISSTNTDMSFGLSQEVSDLGIVGIKISRAANLQTRFDTWIICSSDVSLADILDKLDFGHLTSQFEAARVFSNALSHCFVPYLHVAFGREDVYDNKSSFAPLEFGVTVQIDDISIPSDTPVVKLTDFTLVLQHGSPTDTTAAHVIVNGSSTITIAGYDAECTFSIDWSRDAIAAFIETSSKDMVDDDINVGTTPALGSDGFEGDIKMQVGFPNDKPSVQEIISHFIGDLTDAVGLHQIRQCIPDALAVLMDCVDLRDLQFTVSKSTDTSNKWRLSHFYAEIDLDTLKGDVNLFGTIITFEQPQLLLEIDNPTSDSRSYSFSVTSPMIISGVLCDISAIFSSPPAGLTQDSNSYIKVAISTAPDLRGLPLGKVVRYFMEKALDKLGINQFIPSQVTDVLGDIDVNNIIIGFANVSMDSANHSFKLRFVEATVLSAAVPWTPFQNFQISDVQLHFAHDTGVVPHSSSSTSPSTQISFNCVLTLKSLVLNVNFTHDSSTGGWMFSLEDTGSPLDLVALVLDCADGIGLTVPHSVREEVSAIFDVDVTSFNLAYSPAHTDPTSNHTSVETITFSQNGDVTLFGIDVSSIQIICEKQSSKWNYTIAFALPSPCCPLDAFTKPTGIIIPGLGAIQIVNGYFSLSNGTISSSVTSAPTPKNANPTTMCISGKLMLRGTSFLDLIHSIIKLSEIDINILPGLVDITIPPGGAGLSIMDVFIVKSFDLKIMADGFGLGANVELDCNWLSKDKIDANFVLLVENDGAFGASIEITTDIVEPFHLPGITLTKMGFSLLWLAEAETPQSLSAHGGLVVSGVGADSIEASFAMSINELNPSSNYYKMAIEQLTVANVVKAMTHGHLPQPLDSGSLQCGFKNLVIDLSPSSGDFSINADVFFFALEGKVVADAHVTSGISFAANFNVVDIFGLVKLHAYDKSDLGPFVFLDTTIKDVISNNEGPPAWLGVTGKDDPHFPHLKGSIFALSSSMTFLGTSLGVYGVLNPSGELMLTVEKTEPLPSVPGTSFKMTETLTMVMNGVHFRAGTKYDFKFGLNLPNISIFGISLGSFDGTAIELDGDFVLTATYNPSGWEHDKIDFFVMVAVDVFGLSIHEQFDLDVSLDTLDHIPRQIESLVESKVIDYLEKRLAAPFVAAWDEAKKIAGEAAAALSGAFNVAGEDVVHGLLEAGHEVEAIADALKNELGLGADEVASTLVDFGHDVGQVAQAIGNVFEAVPQEVASALISAGVTVEHAFEQAFGEVGVELSKDFNLVGNSIAGFGADAVDVVGGFVTGDLEQFAATVITDLGDFLEGAGNAFVSVFHHCVVV